MVETKLDSQVILDAGRALGHTVLPDSARELMLVPNGYQVQATEKLIAPYLDAPRRLKADVVLETADSFIRYVEKFQTEATQVFARLEPPSFTAILDYHLTEAKPAWCEHRARYEPKWTQEWQRWIGKNNTRMNQEAFALFLEENQAIISEPKGAELLEMVETLEGHNGIRCNSLIRLSNGRQQLQYEEDVLLKGQSTHGTKQGMIEFPTTISVTVPPFEGGPAYRIVCRLRYRIPNR